MQDNFFYVICRDGQIIEIKNKEETFNAVINAMANKGLVVLKEYGTVLNGVDISKVLNNEQYSDYLSSVKPKEYIRNGVWRDGKEHGVIRYTSWKEEEIKNREPEQIVAPLVDQKKVREYLKKHRPEFVKPYKDD